MAHVFGEIFIRSRQSFRIAREIYNDVPSSVKNVLWIGIGSLSGYFFAMYNMNKLNLPFSDPIPDIMKDNKIFMVTQYRVDPKEVDQFEKNWNQLARRTQKTDGYFYTQLYKTMTPSGKSPRDYLQLVLWRNPKSYSSWLSDQVNRPLVENVKNKCIEAKSFEYTTLFDDSIARMIPP